MKRGALLCAGWWPFVLFPLMLLFVLLAAEWRNIEARVAKNANTALQASDIHWAHIETFNRGRDALVTGLPPTSAAIKQASDIVASTPGVRTVALSGDVIAPPPSAPTLQIRISNQSLELAGTLANHKAISEIETLASTAFDTHTIQSKLRVGEHTAELPALEDLFTALAKSTSAFSTLSASYQDGELVLTGDVYTEEAMHSINQQISSAFAIPLENQLLVVGPPIKQDICQDLVNELLTTGKINFDVGQATLSEGSLPLLDKIAATARRCRDARFEVAGHTDTSGDEQFNKKLSKNRAQTVVEYLYNQGLDKSQFTAVGYGHEQPISDNSTPDGRAQNRRIEFRLKDDSLLNQP